MSKNNSKNPSKDSQRINIKSSSKGSQNNKNYSEDINTNSNNNNILGINDDIIMQDNTIENNFNQIKMSEAKLKEINNQRKNVGLKPFENIYCKICKKYNSHVPWLCPDYTCYICRDKGKHFASNCPNKPRICQWCKSDLNPNNGTPAHTDFQNCPSKPMIIFTKRIRCLLCKRYGHVAKDCNFSNANIYYNFNGFRRNNYAKNKRGYKRGGRGKFRGK